MTTESEVTPPPSPETNNNNTTKETNENIKTIQNEVEVVSLMNEMTMTEQQEDNVNNTHIHNMITERKESLVLAEQENIKNIHLNKREKLSSISSIPARCYLPPPPTSTPPQHQQQQEQLSETVSQFSIQTYDNDIQLYSNKPSSIKSSSTVLNSSSQQQQQQLYQTYQQQPPQQHHHPYNYPPDIPDLEKDPTPDSWVDTSPANIPNSLGHHILNAGLDLQLFPDILINAFGYHYSLHKLILCRSPLLKHILMDNPHLNHHQAWDIGIDQKGFGRDAWESSVRYMYGQRSGPSILGTHIQDTLDILLAAWFLQLYGLVDLIVNILLSNSSILTPRIAIDIGILMDRFDIDIPKLKSKCMSLIATSIPTLRREPMNPWNNHHHSNNPLYSSSTSSSLNNQQENNNSVSSLPDERCILAALPGSWLEELFRDDWLKVKDEFDRYLLAKEVFLPLLLHELSQVQQQDEEQDEEQDEDEEEKERESYISASYSKHTTTPSSSSSQLKHTPILSSSQIFLNILTTCIHYSRLPLTGSRSLRTVYDDALVPYDVLCGVAVRADENRSRYGHGSGVNNNNNNNFYYGSGREGGHLIRQNSGRSGLIRETLAAWGVKPNPHDIALGREGWFRKKLTAALSKEKKGLKQ